MTLVPEEMPPTLREIYEQVRGHTQPRSNLRQLQPAWAAHVARVREQVAGARVEDGGEIVCLGDLSPGCQACKDGAWDCVFVTMRCNLDCPFCYSPSAIPREYAGSVFGTSPAEIARNYCRTEIAGVSFSGGEPFLEVQRLLEWTDWFKEHCPDKYYWVYTNGLLAREAYLRELGALGIDEVRFNAAATGYRHPTVMAHISVAARYVPNVTVEIPAIPAHADTLLESLPEWAARGVRYLNLHELMYEPGTPSAAMPGARQPVCTADGHQTAIDPGSRALVLAVMRRVQELGLPLSVNDCSLQSKLRQLRGRRRSLAPLVQAPHERLLDDAVYESYCAYSNGQARFIHPTFLAEERKYATGEPIVRLVRTAPLSLQDPGQWVVFEELDAGCQGGTW